MSAETRDAEWFRARIVAARAGLLAEDEAERFARLRRDDPTCRALDELFDSEPDVRDASHLPAEWIARWPQVRDKIRGLEEQVVLHHLARCDRCREDLEFAGHALAARDVEAIRALQARAEPQRDASASRRAPGESWFSRVADFVRTVTTWRVLAPAVAAAGALALFVVTRPPALPGVDLVASGRVEGFALAQAPRPTRGAVPRLEITLDETQPGVGLDLSSLPFSLMHPLSDIHVSITVRDSSGTTLAELPERTAEELTRSVLVLGSGRRLTPGRYEVEVRETDPDGQAVTHRFELVVRR